MALLLFGFESIRPSPSFLPRPRAPPSSRLPARPAPLPLRFGAFSFPPRRGGVSDHSDREAGAGPATPYANNLSSGWLKPRTGAGPGEGCSREGAERRGAALVSPHPRPLSALRRRASPAPHLGLPERPRPVPARRARPPQRRAPPLYSWRRGEPGVCSSGRGGGGGWRGVGSAGGGIGSSSSSSSHSQQQPWVPQRLSPRRLPHCLTRPASPPAASPASALSRPPTRPRPCAPAAARAATPPAV